jgi:type IV fimbrial biogenesis protein FimT
MKLQRGVTLIELMVTLTVVAVVMFAVIPDIGAWMRNSQVRNAMDEIHAGLERARNEAVKRNRNVRFTLVSLSDTKNVDNTCAPSSTAASWVVSLADPTGGCGNDSASAPYVLSSYATGQGSRSVLIAATSAGVAANSVIFDGLGRVVSAQPIDDIKITYPSASDTRELHVRIKASGSIRTCDWGVSDPSDPRYCPRS